MRSFASLNHLQKPIDQGKNVVKKADFKFEIQGVAWTIGSTWFQSPKATTEIFPDTVQCILRILNSFPNELTLRYLKKGPQSAITRQAASMAAKTSVTRRCGSKSVAQQRTQASDRDIGTSGNRDIGTARLFLAMHY